MSELVGECLERLGHSDAGLIMVAQGGGMRSVVSMAMLATFYEEGIRAELFDGLYGTSAGAINLAHYIMAEAISTEGEPIIGRSVRVYTEDLTHDFVHLPRAVSRLFGGRQPVVDVGYMIGRLQALNPNAQELMMAGPELFYGMANRQTGQLEFVSSHQVADQFEAMRATAALPVLYDQPVTVNGTEYVDGGTARTLPVAEAIQHSAPRNVCVVSTRPAGAVESRLSPLAARCARRMMRNPSPAIVSLVCGDDPGGYNASMAALESAVEGGGLDTLLVLRPDPEAIVGRTTTNPERLRACAQAARERTKRFLGSEVVEAAGVLRAAA